MRGRGGSVRAARANWRSFAYREWCRLRGDRYLEDLRASEGWSSDALRAVQHAKLQLLLRHAFEHVPYYRPLLLDSGVVTDEARPRIDLARFDRLPVLSRATVRERAGDLQDRRAARSGNRRWWISSAGTTGDPIRVLRDRINYRQAIAGQLWFDEWTGCPFGERKLFLWGPQSQTLGYRARLRYRVLAYLKNEVRLQHHVLNDALIDRYIARINRVRPVQVVGWAGVLWQVARRAERRGVTLAPPRAVLASAEPLWPDMREEIERAFRAPVFNRYGAQEVAGVACECTYRDGLHIAGPTHYVEVLRRDGCPADPGEVGDIVITPLTNYAMPLIRYRIGDFGALTAAPCPCRRPFPRLTGVLGRSLDSFLRADGALVHGVYIRGFYRAAPWVEQFQVIQLASKRVRVRLVDRERSADPAVTRRRELMGIAAHLRRALGEDCEVTFEFLDGIPAEPSGKFRSTVSLVPRTAGDGGGDEDLA